MLLLLLKWKFNFLFPDTFGDGLPKENGNFDVLRDISIKVYTANAEDFTFSFSIELAYCTEFM